MNIKKEDKMEQLEFKGTQGEWKLFIDNVIKSEIFIMAGKIPIIRIAVNNYINKKEAKDNAKLIEEDQEEVIQFAMKAINKALMI